MIEISVIVCTHNPRPQHLQRTLEALRQQKLARTRWELVLVDNASKPPVAERDTIAWHPRGRILKETTLGVNAARRCGMKATSAPVLVFVDDDNCIDPDYLEAALEISAARPDLGVWGGSIVPEFETPPDRRYAELWPYLALRTIESPRWSTSALDTCPSGAGMCLRRSVSDYYLHEAPHSELRFSMGRKGTSLSSGEDIDLALCAHDLGLCSGLFPSLRLVHLIPPGRTSRNYLYAIAVECLISGHVAAALHGRRTGLESWSGPRLKHRLRNRVCRLLQLHHRVLHKMARDAARTASQQLLTRYGLCPEASPPPAPLKKQRALPPVESAAESELQV